jgi:hypothetical protein
VFDSRWTWQTYRSGWGRSLAVEQQPAAGAPLTREVVVELAVDVEAEMK